MATLHVHLVSEPAPPRIEPNVATDLRALIGTATVLEEIDEVCAEIEPGREYITAGAQERT